MSNSLDRVFEVAKKLRKFVKKGSSPELQVLVTDLNLHLADVKVELAEQLVDQATENAAKVEVAVSQTEETEASDVVAADESDSRNPADDFRYTLS